MAEGRWKKLPKGYIVSWCKDRGVIRLSSTGRRPRYLMPRREREAEHKQPPNWRTLNPALVIYWCRGCGCVKFDSGKSIRYLTPLHEIQHRVFIKNLHERCQ